MEAFTQLALHDRQVFFSEGVVMLTVSYYIEDNKIHDNTQENEKCLLIIGNIRKPTNSVFI